MPEQLEFKLPKGVRFPLVIFEGAKDMNQIRKHLSGAFISENLRGAKTFRLLDNFEKATIRANYGELLEDEQPVLETELEAVKEACKKKVKDAEDRLQAVRTQIKDLAFQAKEGVKEFDLPSDSVRMPLDGYYLYYSWLNGEFRLVKVEPIPAWDKDNLFNQLETNKAAFKEVLGIDIDETHNGEVAAQEGGGRVTTFTTSQHPIGKRCAASCDCATATDAKGAERITRWRCITGPTMWAVFRL